MPDSSPSQPQQPRPVGDLFNPSYTVTFFSSIGTATNRPDLPVLSSGGILGNAAASIQNATLTAQNQVTQISLDKAQLDNYAAQLTIDMNLGGPLICTVTLTPPFDDAVNILDQRLIRYGSIMKIEWGYQGANPILAGPFYFRLTQPKVTFNSRDVTFQITGIDITSACLRERTTCLKLDRATCHDDFEVLLALTRSMKMKLDYFQVNQDSLFAKQTTPVPFLGNDWSLFKKLCFDHHVTFQIQDNTTIKLQDWNTVVKQNPIYNFTLYQAPQTNMDIPMISFTANVLQSAFFTPAVRSIMSITPNLDGKVTTAKIIDHSKLNDILNAGGKDDISIAGTGSYSSTSFTDGTTTVNPTPTYDPTRAEIGQRDSHVSSSGDSDRMSEQLILEAALRANTNATVTAPGHPDVLPPMCITVQGVGNSLSGNYFIRSVKHILGRSGYDMTLELIRTLSTADTGKGNKPATPPLNTKAGTGSKFHPVSAN